MDIIKFFENTIVAIFVLKKHLLLSNEYLDLVLKSITEIKILVFYVYCIITFLRKIYNTTLLYSPQVSKQSVAF